MSDRENEGDITRDPPQKIKRHFKIIAMMRDPRGRQRDGHILQALSLVGEKKPT